MKLHEHIAQIVAEIQTAHTNRRPLDLHGWEVDILASYVRNIALECLYGSQELKPVTVWCPKCGPFEVALPASTASGEAKINKERINMAVHAMACDPRDWSSNRTDAWVYALLIGWGDAIGEIVEKHGPDFYIAASANDLITSDD